MKDMDMTKKKSRPVTVDVERLVDRMQCRAAAMDVVEADMSWYGKERHRMRRHTALYAAVAGLLAFALLPALLPVPDYGYMVGDQTSEPHEVCDGMHNVLEKI